MHNYRKAFLIAVIVNVLLLAALGSAIWWRGGSHRLNREPVSPASTNAQPIANPANPAETPLAPVQLSPERLQSIGVKFGAVVRKPVDDELRETGNVAIDETRLYYVQTRFSGYVLNVFADAAYKYVRKGQPLFTIYSPEVAAAEREYLIARQNARQLSTSTIPGVAAGANSLLDTSLDRLRQWDIPQSEIARLETSGQAQQHIEIDSPASGYITERHALPNLTVQPDTHLYTIADLSTVWVFAQVYQNDLGRIRVGEAAALTVDSYPGKTFSGRVDFIYPDIDMTTRTARVRLVFSNPNLLLTPGMFVNVALRVPLGMQTVIPVDGVLQSGTREIVFVDHGSGYLEPRQVQLGPEANGEYIVLNGLKPRERIVTSANFLIDSESQLQAAIGSFVPPPPGAGAAAAVNSSAVQPGAQIEFSTDPATPRKGRNEYRVKLTASDGSPVTGAQVTLRSFMPAMPDMGMAAMNVVTRLNEKGAGLYEAHVNLDTGGTWQITVTATKNGSLLATKQLSINAEGGM